MPFFESQWLQLAFHGDRTQGYISFLETKAILHLIIIMDMSCSLGLDAVFSVIPVSGSRGSITALAGLSRPHMTMGSLTVISVALSAAFPAGLKKGACPLFFRDD